MSTNLEQGAPCAVYLRVPEDSPAGRDVLEAARYWTREEPRVYAETDPVRGTEALTELFRGAEEGLFRVCLVPGLRDLGDSTGVRMAVLEYLESLGVELWCGTDAGDGSGEAGSGELMYTLLNTRGDGGQALLNLEAEEFPDEEEFPGDDPEGGDLE